MERIIEICCGSYEDALAAYHGGAKRIELNSALHLGGLTPSLGTLILCKKHTDLKVIAMVRPRGAGFCYTEAEFETMKTDAELLMKHGADGIAFGCLDSEGSIHTEQTKIMVDIIKTYHGEAVFHRAFDCVNDPYGSMEQLIELNIDRVLTSGLKAKAMDGITLIAELQKRYGTRIELLAGSGIHAENAQEMMDKTGIWQVHSSCKGWATDPTTTGTEVSYSFAEAPHADDYDIVDETLVRKLVQGSASGENFFESSDFSSGADSSSDAGSFEKIYEVVRQIPKGKVATYGQIAALAGNRRWARVVGYALHVNPDPDTIPCYRVVNRMGEVSAAFAFGGGNRQIELLEADGIPCTDGVVDLKKYQWERRALEELERM